MGFSIEGNLGQPRQSLPPTDSASFGSLKSYPAGRCPVSEGFPWSLGGSKAKRCTRQAGFCRRFDTTFYIVTRRRASGVTPAWRDRRLGASAARPRPSPPIDRRDVGMIASHRKHGQDRCRRACRSSDRDWFPDRNLLAVRSLCVLEGEV